MSEPRLAASFWVAAYMRRLSLHEIPAFVVNHGDDTAGAVLVKLNTLDGNARIFTRSFDLLSDTRHWSELASGADRDMDAHVTKQRSFDPDLWVIEVEDRQGRHLLDQPGLDS
ncbi:hypothetical protein P775_03210 [Puniceibacterium antarcticum]|uniref:GTP-binding protein Era n=1 Tax=Puniceibacterium antarcticum TaxID=1206336 RepID=A0A2G8RJC3_9RHOB|nr:DUF1491 family protein [Puniceibacterium antarcticum]PIL21684.1 hypothetical protein P775_03210 [Puniceibacterium antarcticum]